MIKSPYLIDRDFFIDIDAELVRISNNWYQYKNYDDKNIGVFLATHYKFNIGVNLRARYSV